MIRYTSMFIQTAKGWLSRAARHSKSLMTREKKRVSVEGKVIYFSDGKGYIRTAVDAVRFFAPGFIRCKPFLASRPHCAKEIA